MTQQKSIKIFISKWLKHLNLLKNKKKNYHFSLIKYSEAILHLQNIASKARQTYPSQIR
jgi:hypothetical protein